MRFRGTIDKGSRVGDGCKGIRGIFGEQREGGNFDDDIDSDFFPSTHQRIPSPTTPDNSNTTGLHLFAPRTSVQFNFYQSQFGACKKGQVMAPSLRASHRIDARIIDMCLGSQAGHVRARTARAELPRISWSPLPTWDRPPISQQPGCRCRHEEVCRDSSDRTPNAEGQMMTNPGLSE